MTFYINSNLSPTEAVKMHTELQVHPIIEEWAIAAEQLENMIDDEIQMNLYSGMKKILEDKELKTEKQLRKAVKDLFDEQL